SRGAAFEVDERLHRFFIHRAAESVNGLRRVCENLSGVEVRNRSRYRRPDFFGGPKRNDEPLSHSRKILSDSASVKSDSVVILSPRSLPGTVTQGTLAGSPSAA